MVVVYAFKNNGVSSLNQRQHGGNRPPASTSSQAPLRPSHRGRDPTQPLVTGLYLHWPIYWVHLLHLLTYEGANEVIRPVLQKEWPTKSIEIGACCDAHTQVVTQTETDFCWLRRHGTSTGACSSYHHPAHMGIWQDVHEKDTTKSMQSDHCPNDEVPRRSKTWKRCFACPSLCVCVFC